MLCEITYFLFVCLFVGEYWKRIEWSFGYVGLVMIELSEEMEKDGEKERIIWATKYKEEICV